MENKRKNKSSSNKYDIGNGGVLEWGVKVSNLSKIQLKKLFKTPFMLFGVFGIPLILLFGIGTLVPTHSLLTPCFGLEAIVVAGIIFGDLYYNIEKSTMKNATETVNIGPKTKLFTISLVTMLITLLAMTVEFIVFISFETLGWFFMSGFVFFPATHYQSVYIMWTKISWFDLIYFVILNILLTIALFIFAKNFFASNKTFIMFVLVYILLDLIFGGVLIMTYNAPEVIVDPATGNIVATGYLYKDSLLENYSLTNRFGSDAWGWNSWYAYVKFLIPHFFLNQQFSTLFRAGAHQSSDAMWFDSNNVLNFNWDLMWKEDGTLDNKFNWLQYAQHYIVNGIDTTTGNPIGMLDTGSLMNNEQWSTWMADSATPAIIYSHSVDNANAIQYMAASYCKLLPQNANYWKAYEGDYTFILSALLPWVYTIGLTIIGFLFTRVSKK